MGATTAFVWVWLPTAVDPVVAGRLDQQGAVVSFTYGRSYLGRTDAIALYLPELPLTEGTQAPLSGDMAGCIADAGPDAWGRRVIEHSRSAATTDLGPLDYLLESGSDRIGALDFQARPDRYVARIRGPVPLADLARAAATVEAGDPLPDALELALLHGTSVGGARPKATIVDGDRHLIAKFSSAADPYPVVKAEYIAMALARRVGLDIARVELATALGRDVLLVERFDRPDRRLMVSALTILELHDADGIAGRYASYADLAHQIRARFTAPDATLRELFARITFNVLVGNTDDHARNHAAFWDGRQLTLTPAYDICPQNRTGEEAAQAMAYGEDGERRSQVARCIERCGTYHLDAAEARAIVEHQIEVINDAWTEVADEGSLTKVDRDRLWGRQILNPFALYDL